jgi:hypothetical protein
MTSPGKGQVPKDGLVPDIRLLGVNLIDLLGRYARDVTVEDGDAARRSLL